MTFTPLSSAHPALYLEEGAFSNLSRGAEWVLRGLQLIQHGQEPTARAKGTALICLSVAQNNYPLPSRVRSLSRSASSPVASRKRKNKLIDAENGLVFARGAG